MLLGNRRTQICIFSCIFKVSKLRVRVLVLLVLNPGFVSLGNKLGKEKLFKYIKNFGFGEKTGIDLNGEAKGILFNLNKVGPVELATTAFGQGISVTAIQQIAAVSAAVNGGTLYKPYVVKRIVEPNTKEIIQENKPSIIRKVISNETSQTVRSTLETVVAYGTGRNAYIEGYRVGGKTGTAQKVQNGIYLSGNYIVSFIGFIPADNPQAVVYVAIDNPKGITQYGGTVSAPIAKSIMIDIIDTLDIPKSEYTLDKEEFWYDIKYTTIPNVLGQDLTTAKKQLKNLNINYSGTGNIIKEISPQPGTIIKENSTIKILLGN